MKKQKNKEPKIFQYRIKYNAESSESAINNYHYFLANSPKEALDFHLTMARSKMIEMQTLSIEEYNSYADRWEDRSSILNQEA